MLVQFEEHTFRRSSYQLIDQCNAIVKDYQARGYSLTLRQLYYRLVAANVIPNKQRAYKNLGDLVRNARMAGLISWGAIEDRTRSLRGVHTYDNPAQCFDHAVRQYATDLWQGQETRVEVWVEKDALSSVVGQACLPYRVDYFSCRGYTSISEMFTAGYYRFRQEMKAGRDVVIIHLGDHDPSGVDMTRDIQERLELFAGEHDGGGQLSIRRIALNMNQVEEMKLPPNPAKMTDSRVGGYMAEHGSSSWELDAIDPDQLTRLIRNEITLYIDQELWDKAVMAEREQIATMRRMVAQLEQGEE